MDEELRAIARAALNCYTTKGDLDMKTLKKPPTAVADSNRVRMGESGWVQTEPQKRNPGETKQK